MLKGFNSFFVVVIEFMLMLLIARDKERLFSYITIYAGLYVNIELSIWKIN